jgi:hypothetical protein
MRSFLRIRFSIAQLLVATLMVAVICSGTVLIERIRAHRFPPEVQDIQISPDGSRLGLALRGPGEFCCLVCDSSSGRFLRSFESAEGRPVSLAIARDLDAFAAVFADGRLEVGRITSGATSRASPSAEFKHWFANEQTGEWTPISVLISGDGAICALTYDKHVEIIDAPSARRVNSFVTSITARHSVGLSNDGRCFVVTDAGHHNSEVWDTLEGRRLALDTQSALGAAWVGNETLAFVPWARPMAVCVRRIQKNEKRAEGSEPYEFVSVRDEVALARTRSVSASPPLVASSDGKVLAATYEHCIVVVLDAATLETRYPAVETKPGLYVGDSLAASDDGKSVAAGLVEEPYWADRPQRKLWVVDMPTGTARELWPNRNERARVVGVLAYVLAGLGVGTWLLWRTAPRDALRNSRKSGPAVPVPDGLGATVSHDCAN